MWSSRPKRHDVANLLRYAGSFGLSRGARQRLAWFAYALAHDGNVSLACRYFGISRSTFLRWAKRFDARRPETLEEQSRRPHTVRAPETDAAVVEHIRRYRLSSPMMGKQHIARKLNEDHSLTVSASTVGRVIERHGFFFGDRPSHQRKRAGIDFSPGMSPTAPSATTSSVSAPETGEAGALPAPDLPLFGS